MAAVRKKNSVTINTRILSTVAIVFSMTFLLGGCAPRRLAAVNADLARATLVDVLETWKKGGTIDQLRARDPEVVVQEPHWSSGQQLQSYELLDTGRIEDANLFCEVELTLTSPDGSPPKQKTVTYVIGTEPVLTVFRAIL